MKVINDISEICDLSEDTQVILYRYNEKYPNKKDIIVGDSIKLYDNIFKIYLNKTKFDRSYTYLFSSTHEEIYNLKINNKNIIFNKFNAPYYLRKQLSHNVNFNNGKNIFTDSKNILFYDENNNNMVYKNIYIKLNEDIYLIYSLSITTLPTILKNEEYLILYDYKKNNIIDYLEIDKENIKKIINSIDGDNNKYEDIINYSNYNISDYINDNKSLNKYINIFWKYSHKKYIDDIKMKFQPIYKYKDCFSYVDNIYKNNNKYYIEGNKLNLNCDEKKFLIKNTKFFHDNNICSFLNKKEHRQSHKIIYEDIECIIYKINTKMYVLKKNNDILELISNTKSKKEYLDRYSVINNLK